MRVYTKVTIDMRTLEVVDEESFDYVGPVAECKGGGGGGGGSGKISYPTYMETQHTAWLTDVDGYMDAAMTTSPYVGALAYAPDTDLGAIDTAIAAFNTIVDALDADTDYITFSSAVAAQVDTAVINTANIESLVAAHAAVVDADYDDTVAKLQSGSRDIGVAMTSAFITAQGDLYAKKGRDITEFSKRLYVEAERQRNEMITTGINNVFQASMQRVQFEGDVARLTADARRIRIVAKGEETRENIEYDDLDAKWDLEITNYGAQMMASIGGGTVTRAAPSMSKTQSVLSGAMSGAAMGAMVGGGNPWAIGVGAALGMVGGLLD